ncbi:MAG: CRTAC1 family protein [Gemmataceae bacterium]|nr:CRTAC1 family protein [Gemmataceae bacterium]
MKLAVLGVAALFLLLAGGAAALWVFSKTDDNLPPPDGPLWLKDITDEVGLDFVHDAGDLNQYQLPQIHGSGVALFDFDGDGRVDIYLLTHGGPKSKSINRLFKNMPDGSFKDVTEGSGLGIAGFNTGVAIGDVNNDGWPDVLVTQYGGVKLFLNNSKGTFSDVTEEAGLKNPLWATSASFVDYNRDGWLDLVVVNYLENDPSFPCRTPSGAKEFCGPNAFPGTVSKIFRNLGNARKGRVEFQDVTVAAGLSKAPAPGLGVYCADFNGDAWPDIFIANDGKPNHLWINQKEKGTFAEEAYLHGVAVDGAGMAQAGMGVAIGDIDGDGLFDLYVTHLATERNTLWRQGPKRGSFNDRTAAAGLVNSAWRGTGFGSLMGDFDNDGWLDLAVVNGRIARHTTTSLSYAPLGEPLMRYAERNQLFRNEGLGKLRDVSESNAPFSGTPNVARGLASGDLNNDGGLDLVVTTVAGPARVFRNVAPKRGHWLRVQALDPRLKRDAYGAEVTIQAGTRKWLRIIQPSDSYQSSSDPRAHFGLGETATFDAVHVFWPDGLAETFPGGSADRTIVLSRGEGKE